MNDIKTPQIKPQIKPQKKRQEKPQTASTLNALEQDAADQSVTNPSAATATHIGTLIADRLSRRGFLKSAFAASALAPALSGCADGQEGAAVANKSAAPTPHKSAWGRYDFTEIEHGFSYDQQCAPDHAAEVLLSWGDPITADAPPFDFYGQSVDAQLKQFGFNCDYVGYLQLAPGNGESDRGLLCVNHEYPNPKYIFPDFNLTPNELTLEQVNIELAAMGLTVVEVFARDGVWQVDVGSSFNRRITPLASEFKLSGPVAGHPRVQTALDPSGTRVIGTVNNCAGGMTPWGTFLTCEENFNYHFGGELAANHPEASNHARYNVPQDYMGWSNHVERFNLEAHPTEPNRFGWVVEIDPTDPEAAPIKRTAMGRFKHEGAENQLSSDGRLVVYMGDDQAGEYLYKFISRDAVDLTNKAANKDLLDHGTLHVAKFHDDGALSWLPLDLSVPALAEAFETMADLLIETRRAAELVGATPMDRPEDVVPNKVTNKVYVMLTNNVKRMTTNAANDRRLNLFGHVIELTEADQDAGATSGRWEIIVRCGDPERLLHRASWNPETSVNGWFASPDNAAVDPMGRLWIATDQGSKVDQSGTLDGLWALETEGDLRGAGRMFYRAPRGAELTGPCFNTTGDALFMAVQHPGSYDKTEAERAEGGLIDWPHFTANEPAKPSIVVVTRRGGGRVG